MTGQAMDLEAYIPVVEPEFEKMKKMNVQIKEKINYRQMDLLERS